MNVAKYTVLRISSCHIRPVSIDFDSYSNIYSRRHQIDVMAELGFGGKCVKYILFVINIIVALVGLVLVGVGIWVLADSKVLKYFGAASSSDQYHLVLSSASIVLVVGVLSFVVGAIGCCGAIREKMSLLNCYACMTIVLMLFEVIAVILAGVYHSKINDAMHKELLKTMQEGYKRDNNDTVKQAWDVLQHSMKCCGVYSPRDWWNSTWNANMTERTVPKSCCQYNNGTVKDVKQCTADAFSSPPKSDYVYLKGCASYLDWIESHVEVIIAFVAILLLLELVLVIMTCCLKANIGRGYEYV